MFEWISDSTDYLASKDLGTDAIYESAGVAVAEAASQGRLSAGQEGVLYDAIDLAKTAKDPDTARSILEYARTVDNNSDGEGFIGEAAHEKSNASTSLGDDVAKGATVVGKAAGAAAKNVAGVVSSVTPWWVVALIILAVLYAVQRETR